MNKDRERFQGQVKMAALPVIPVIKDGHLAEVEHHTKFTVERDRRRRERAKEHRFKA
jgi:hypothetical protein